MDGLLKHSKALVISTTGGPEEYYQSTGYLDAFVKTADGFLRASGIQNVSYTCFYAVQSVEDEERKAFLETAHRLGVEF
jgi:putative NADPH-quinone reductase